MAHVVRNVSEFQLQVRLHRLQVQNTLQERTLLMQESVVVSFAVVAMVAREVWIVADYS